MSKLAISITIDEDAFADLPAIQQEMLLAIMNKHPGVQVPPRKHIKITELETPESVARIASDKIDDMGSVDVTDFHNVVKPARSR